MPTLLFGGAGTTVRNMFTGSRMVPGTTTPPGHDWPVHGQEHWQGYYTRSGCSDAIAACEARAPKSALGHPRRPTPLAIEARVVAVAAVAVQPKFCATGGQITDR